MEELLHDISVGLRLVTGIYILIIIPLENIFRIKEFENLQTGKEKRKVDYSHKMSRES